MVSSLHSLKAFPMYLFITLMYSALTSLGLFTLKDPLGLLIFLRGTSFTKNTYKIDPIPTCVFALYHIPFDKP